MYFLGSVQDVHSPRHGRDKALTGPCRKAKGAKENRLKYHLCLIRWPKHIYSGRRQLEALHGNTWALLTKSLRAGERLCRGWNRKSPSQAFGNDFASEVELRDQRRQCRDDFGHCASIWKVQWARSTFEDWQTLPNILGVWHHQQRNWVEETAQI